MPAIPRQRLFFCVAWLCCLGALSACVPSLPRLEQHQERQQYRFDDLTITLDTNKDPIINATETFRITLTNRFGQPIDNANVYLDLDMIMLCLSGSMPIAQAQGNGIYETLSVYQMAGNWDVTVITEYEESEYRALFTIPVSET